MMISARGRFLRMCIHPAIRCLSEAGLFESCDRAKMINSHDFRHICLPVKIGLRMVTRFFGTFLPSNAKCNYLAKLSVSQPFRSVLILQDREPNVSQGSPSMARSDQQPSNFRTLDAKSLFGLT